MVGAGTNNPATLLRVLGPEPLNIAYVEPSFRADDGRFAENPNRVQMHHQLQVILKPIPYNAQQIYLDSLYALGLSYQDHDFRFVEDNWESPVIGAWGLGWEVWLDGMEITQYTYFQQAGALTLETPACELTYGLERIAMYLQGVDTLFDIQWNEQYTYGELLREQEIQFCNYNFHHADISRLFSLFDLFEEEATSALENNLPVPAYDYICRCSQTFNILDARGAVGVGERANFFARMRNLSRRVATMYVEQREALGFPLAGRSRTQVLPSLEQSSTAEQKTPSLQNDQESADLVIEFGFEELAAFVPDPIQRQAEEQLPALLEHYRIEHEGFKVQVTPRRLLVHLTQVASHQYGATRQVKGPSKQAAERNPKALEGFCRKYGISPEEVKFITEGKNTFASLEFEEERQPIGAVLPELVAMLFSKFNYGKSMRWLPDGTLDQKISFNRPIRWILALHGEKQVPLKFAGLKASNLSYGPRWQNSPELFISDTSHYFKELHSAKVVLDTNKRREAIVKGLNEKAQSVGGTLGATKRLVDEIVHLVETPVVFLGTIDEELSRLPQEVIQAVIEKHIRCFAVYDQNGKALPYFLGVSNGAEAALKNVTAGFERVIVARLTDARFFIERDRKSGLATRVSKLETMTIHEKFGSIKKKVDRLTNMIQAITESFSLNENEQSNLKRLTELAKCDLGTEMVTEITSLQGQMGQIYASQEGESDEVAEAVFEHYLPRSPGDRLPKSRIAIALGVADRLDTLTGFISLGLEPTGSADPYALRREALGLLTLLLEVELDLDLRPLLAEISSQLSEQINDLEISREESANRVLTFLERRLEGLFRERGMAHDVTRAVLKSGRHNPYLALRTAERIKQLSETKDFQDALPAYLRCKRLVDQNPPTEELSLKQL